MYVFCKRRYALLVTVLLFPFLVPAQSSLYSLKELIDSGSHYLPLLMEKSATVNSYKAIVTDTRHSFLPQLKLNEQINAGTDNSLAGAYLPIGANPSVSAGVRGVNNYQAVSGNIAVLYTEYDLEDFGLKTAKIKNAVARADEEEADLQRILYQLKIEISRLYFNLLKDEYRLSADNENIKRYENIYSVINALARSGIRPGSDTSLSKAELSEAKINYNQTLGDLNALKQQLAYWCGISANQIRVDTAALHSFTNYSSLENIPVDTLHHPFIDFYNKQKQVFISNEKLINKTYLPKILLAGSSWARGSGIQYNDKYGSFSDGLGFQRYNYMAGLAVTYDLFNGIHRRDKLAIGRFQTQASDYALRQEKLDLNNASLQADNALRTAENNLQELPVQLQSATEVYGQKIAQYKAGIINLIDLTNASFVLYRSQTDYIETLGNWYLARLDKASATGNLDQFIQSIK
ncbi:MAG TPA: TolC family protein [Chitinophagaceae bacterium]